MRTTHDAVKRAYQLGKRKALIQRLTGEEYNELVRRNMSMFLSLFDGRCPAFEKALFYFFKKGLKENTTDHERKTA